MQRRKKIKTGERTSLAHRKDAVLSSSEFVARRKEDALAHPELIISIKEARKLLGKDANSMSDDQIAEYILLFTSMGSDFLQDLGSTNYNG